LGPAAGLAAAAGTVISFQAVTASLAMFLLARATLRQMDFIGSRQACAAVANSFVQWRVSLALARPICSSLRSVSRSAAPAPSVVPVHLAATCGR
jgi:hypothetical protein